MKRTASPHLRSALALALLSPGFIAAEAAAQALAVRAAASASAARFASGAAARSAATGAAAPAALPRMNPALLLIPSVSFPAAARALPAAGLPMPAAANTATRATAHSTARSTSAPKFVSLTMRETRLTFSQDQMGLRFDGRIGSRWIVPDAATAVQASLAPSRSASRLGRSAPSAEKAAIRVGDKAHLGNYIGTVKMLFADRRAKIAFDDGSSGIYKVSALAKAVKSIGGFSAGDKAHLGKWIVTVKMPFADGQAKIAFEDGSSGIYKVSNLSKSI